MKRGPPFGKFSCQSFRVFRNLSICDRALIPEAGESRPSTCVAFRIDLRRLLAKVVAVCGVLRACTAEFGAQLLVTLPEFILRCVGGAGHRVICD